MGNINVLISAVCNSSYLQILIQLKIAILTVICHVGIVIPSTDAGEVWKMTDAAGATSSDFNAVTLWQSVSIGFKGSYSDNW